MNVSAILGDKSIKPKQRSKQIAELLLEDKKHRKEFISVLQTATAADKGNAIEALTFATDVDPSIVDVAIFNVVCKLLSDRLPRVKWEAARLLANTVHLFPGRSGAAIAALLDNSEHPGTVVRWSAAKALSAIVVTRHSSTKSLIPVIEAIMNREENNAVRKIYKAALNSVREKKPGRNKA